MSFKPLPIGVDNFKKLITNEFYYVDKTLLIKDLLDNKAEVNLFTRPRRFGKTLNISMLKYFFEKSIDNNGLEQDNSALFKNTKIINEDDKYLGYMSKYPVINMSFKSAKQPNFELAYSCIKDDIISEFNRHSYILDSEKISKEDKNTFIRICSKEDDKKLYVTSLKFLCECLQKYHENKVIILIDEYDVPLENSYFRGFYSEMIDFIRSLFESALKTNDSLEFAVITGCLRISKESIFTDLNNLRIISILDNYYSEYFGFTPEEVRQMMKYYEIESKTLMVKKWYNGYLFGDTRVYNPWSVINIVADLYKNINFLPRNYWVNTSSNSIVRNLIDRADLSVKEEIENLIMGKSIEKDIHEDITYDEIYDSMDNLWNFLFFTGYLKKVEEKIDSNDKKTIVLEIPNAEVKSIFKEKILKWFNDKIKTKDLSKMYNAILNGDSLTFENELVSILEQSISFNDSYENFYHGFLLGVLMNIKNYIVRSNRESGNGRSDIIIRYPNRRGCAVILELKVADNIGELNKKCIEALEQIDRNRYDMDLINDGYTNILKYGIAFYKKDCMIKKK